MLSNTAIPRYYGEFRDSVLRGDIPVNQKLSLEMNRIDYLISNPGIYYDDQAVNGWVRFCENELTLTDGSDFQMLDSFKLWGKRYSDGTITLKEAYMFQTKMVMVVDT